MKLETDRLILRRWEYGDLVPFRAINGDPRVMEFYPSVNDATESDRILRAAETHFDQHGFGLFATELKSSGELLGFVGLQRIPYETHFTPAVEIGWRIAFEHWNKGYATEAARACLDDGFTRLGLAEIVAMTAVINHRSRRVMEKLGMTYNSKDDFDHPKVAEGHILRPHVLYRLKRDH